MADHLIKGTMTYAVIHCGNLSCQSVWEQPNTPLDDPGSSVCPFCLFGAPTNVDRELAAPPRSQHVPERSDEDGV